MPAMCDHAADGSEKGDTTIDDGITSTVDKSMTSHKAKNTPDANLTPPAWFVKYEDNMNANFDKLLARLAVINERLDKVAQTQLKQGAAILQNSRTIAQLDERLSGELNELRRRQNESSEMLSKLQKRLTVFASTARDADVPPTSSTPTVDSCKVRVTGIPTSLSDSDITTTERILKALQLDRLTPSRHLCAPGTAGRADTLNTPHLPRLPLEYAQMPVVREQ
ncbi:unnamed protein product [Trichogramma brassicae]|uniref:Uncharacterized protein n=1 Tax=Trichogramma brassicae TaxID=86971 RepID=A0A6H5IXL6_9HYME|nr:unnamed protein product [Trichogramma brassicae]